MINLSRWKIALVAFATIFGLIFTLPNLLPASATSSWPAAFRQKLNLGLDLQGGSYLLLEVDTAALGRERLVNLVEDVRTTLREARIVFSGLGQQNGQVTVRITDPARVTEARNLLARAAGGLATAQGGAPEVTVATGADGLITLTPSADAGRAAAGRAVEQSIEIIRRRIDELGTREPTIIRQGVDRIVVQAPGESDPERLKAIIGQTAKLTFQMVDATVSAEEAAAGRVPPGSVLLPSSDGIERAVLVERRALVTGEQLQDAQAGFDQQTGAAVVNFRFNGAGARRFGEATQANVGRRFAIVLDGRVISAPTINEPILGGSGQISGNFTAASANDLALLLRGGALPAPLTVQEQRTVGAELGADAVKAGQVSTALGFALIVVFMLLTYGLLFGGISVIALLVNGLLIVAAMSLTQATLTLPGIAGLILTLAVAVDANVLIYERMREEVRAGRSVIAAADAGFSRAMVTIIDANVTTLAAAAIMFVFGAGPVRGFAWTLSIGVFTSVFSAVLVSQVLIGLWLKGGRRKTLPIA